MKWTRTDTGVRSAYFRIERIVDKHVWTKREQVWGYRLVNESTGETLSFGRMTDAKAWAEEEYAEYELKLTRELGELQKDFTLCDDSEENKAKGRRIREIREELGLICKPRADRHPPILRSR